MKQFPTEKERDILSKTSRWFANAKDRQHSRRQRLSCLCIFFYYKICVLLRLKTLTNVSQKTFNKNERKGLYLVFRISKSELHVQCYNFFLANLIPITT